MKNIIAERLERFKRFMDEEGVFIHYSGNDEDDYDMIVGVLKHNGGFWSGDKYRLYFDEELNFTTATERPFGLNS